MSREKMIDKDNYEFEIKDKRDLSWAHRRLKEIQEFYDTYFTSDDKPPPKWIRQKESLIYSEEQKIRKAINHWKVQQRRLMRRRQREQLALEGV